MTSNYAKRMALLSARIFVENPRPQTKGTDRIIRIMSENPKGIQKHDWYHPVEEMRTIWGFLRFHGHYRDEYRDFKEEMQRLRELRGKKTVKWYEKKGLPPKETKS